MENNHVEVLYFPEKKGPVMVKRRVKKIISLMNSGLSNEYILEELDWLRVDFYGDSFKDKMKHVRKNITLAKNFIKKIKHGWFEDVINEPIHINGDIINIYIAVGSGPYPIKNPGIGYKMIKALDELGITSLFFYYLLLDGSSSRKNYNK